ncbi:hypothetical protein F5144DRAFT_655621 [Chaetomium tenue]|uniref:Uncharacterized protein n=1 Tax=Chaetomium tenue TaxID=1854479 RepID=A0ACB7P6W3_9PEZI|nr:hypothetical protein F5144DRAFT_655621 [Chaetomium globosum]
MPDNHFVHEPIAIIGSGCRLPGGASSPSKLWELLRDPRDVLRKIDRFDVDGFYHPEGRHHGTANVQHAHLLDEDFRLFDPGFFGIKPVEAESIDPLQRLLLETVYESLENAGLPIERLHGSDTAFYAGVMATDYTDLLMRDVDTIPQYFATATARSIISNRVSMLALHGAVTSLRTGESRVAVAAGGNLILGPELFIALSKVNMLSPQGRSAMWDAGADGYGRGEGFVSIVMKKLSDAIADGDHIDCIIRESATNQDGRTMGITMPSAQAQAELIKTAYANVGLDLRSASDRPQFFEAHGTGTKAGDPQEAEAIHTAFFGDGTFDTAPQSHPLYVGGIKTVVGHTEGTAGLSGLLKASLSLQAGVIPPNLLFRTLNPDLIPFYGPLEVPTAAVPWPPLAEGSPRRASVNSFGFGGANTHVILESHTPSEHPPHAASWTDASSTLPFVFSASSEAALQRSLVSYQDYLANKPGVNLSNLSWTLRARRSALPVKVAISASNVGQLQNKIQEKLSSLESAPGSAIGIRSKTGERKILGVFTGQGAQWATMGKQLIDTIPRARDLANKLDGALQALPHPYKPSWSILAELSRDSSSSRLQEAAFSQPLCTVVQVILVDLLRIAGIQFSAVVGHSSGEICAAYAAGFLSAEDATKIAYLRGYFAGLAKGRSGEKGAMMAVGASMEGAQELCDLPEFRGKIKVAASNSSSSVTLSGDAEAISQAKSVLDDRKTFARALKVDTAYHSHHMQPCAEPYVEALVAAGITLKSPTSDCVWYSSVLDGAKVELNDTLGGTYWRDNMVNTVLFSQAVTAAVNNGGPFHLALEVGPHPALKGPASQTLAELGVEIPYSGALKRGESDFLAFSDCLGSVWANLGASAVDFEAIHTLLPEAGRPTLLKNLPTYAWDHDKPYWYESRKSKQYRTRSQIPHALLGTRADDGTGIELRWRNFLSVQDLPWLEGHQIQSQVVFPAAGYISMVLEAAQMMAKEEGHDIQLLEVCDLNITRALVFPDEKAGIETTTALSNITVQADAITGNFAISAHLSRDATHLTKVADGTVRVVIGSSPCPLAPRTATPAHLIPIDSDRFYFSLQDVGYGYTREFRTCSDMRRRLDFCTGSIQKPEDNSLLVHPGVLDQAFQALFGAYCWPGDGRFWTLFLPKSVRKITVDLPQYITKHDRLDFDAWLGDSPSKEMRGDVFFSGGNETVIQVEGASMVSVNQTSGRDDRPMFFETVWGVAAPDGDLAAAGERATAEEWEMAEACERVAHYYWRKLDETLTPYEREHCAENHKYLLAAIKHLLGRPMDGKQSYLKPEWQNDDEKTIEELRERYPSSIDIKLSVSVGRALPAVLRGETTILEHMRPDNMLDDFYSQSLGLPASNRSLGKMVKQLTHRYPRMNFIEIGAGTGSSTQAILDVVDNAYASYTFTDISSGFFEKAAARFEGAGDKMIFKTFDAEKDPADQGYKPGSYDVVVASNVLHATTNLHNTLRNVRALLKPGGFLFLLEITDNTSIRYSFSMGGLSGWWLGVNDGRPYSPCITRSKWNQALRKAGFAGVSAVTPAHDIHPNPFSVIASQAVEEKMDQLRRPLLKVQFRGDTTTNAPLYILGGLDLETSNIVEDIVAMVEHHFQEVITIDTLEEIVDGNMQPNATVLNLLDLDGPVFKDMTPARLKALQVLIESTQHLLWITHAQERENPWSNASVGFLRSVSAELPILRAQILDFGLAESPAANTSLIAESLLRLLATGPWERDPLFKDQMLWTTEPELRFHGGRLWIPRVVGHRDNDDRINAHRRSIKREATGAADAPVKLHEEEDGVWALRQHYVPKAMPSGTGRADAWISVRVRYSTLRALVADDAGSALLLVVGQLVETGRWVVALAAERASVVQVDRACVVELPDGFSEDAALGLLKVVLAEGLAGRIVKLAGRHGGLLLVHEPDAPLVRALLSRQSQSQGGFEVKFTTQDPARAKDGAWIYLHPRQSARAARQVLPSIASAFVSLSQRDTVEELITSVLPASCRVWDADFVFQKESAVLPTTSWETIGAQLAPLVTTAVSGNVTAQLYSAVDADVASLESLQEGSSQALRPLTLVDWQFSPSLSLEVSPPLPSKIFKSDKSYMLVGMTGEMGQSLCRWMVHHGAGAVIMTSRNPKIDKAWIDELEAIGAKIKVAGFDATSRDAWVKFAAEVRQDFPPLAGIINGAVVLQDQFFLEMDINGFNGTLKPKVDSTIHLDEVFRDDPLDFFLVFSSLSSIIGNRGQANYNAANAFMTSFVQQRRARGQAASVLQLGSVVGVGFLTRAGDVMEQILVKYGYLPVSEVDLQHLVAQCVMAGLPGSGENPDIITGLRYAYEDEDTGVHWVNNPRFAHMVLPPEKESIDSGDKKVVLSTRAQLAAAGTELEACKALEGCFGAKLRAMLQMDEASFRADAALIEMGVDSLVAVEIRSWFLKEVDVDMAVLKILGGASTVELSQFAVEKMPRDLLPGLAEGAVTPSDNAAAPIKVEEKPSAPASPESAGSDTGKDFVHTDAHPESETTSTSPSAGSPTPFTPAREPPTESPPSSIGEEEVIVKRPDPEVTRRVRVSSAQSRFWFLNMFLSDRTSSNVTLSYNVRGHVRASDLARAVKQTTNAHEALRTCFIADRDSTEKAWQGVMQTSKVELDHRTVVTDEEISAAYQQVRNTVYDLGQGETMQIVLLSKNQTTHTIIFGYHHIVLDGVGFTAFVADLERAYKGQRPSPQGLQYADFSEQEGVAIEKGSLQQNLAYWKNKFQELPPLLPLLPVANVTTRQAVSTYGSSYVERRLDARLAEGLKACCKKFHVTSSHVYLATFRVMLMRLAGVADLCIGLADANRHESNVTSTVGLFLNMLPLRFKQSSEATFGDILKETRGAVYEGLGHAGVPFDELLQALQVPRSSSNSPLFQAFFDYHRGAQEKLDFADTTWENADRNPGERAYDITLDVIEGSAGSLVSLIGQEYLYGLPEMQKLLDCYLTLLEQLVNNPSMLPSAARLFGENQVQAALDLGCGSRLEFEWAPTLGHRVEEICRQFPHAVAIRDGGVSNLTYHDLKNKAWAIREQLLAGGVKPGDRVAVLQEATPDWICSVIAIFWAGAVYVPMVLLNPVPRLMAIIQAAKPTAILAHDATSHLIPKLEAGNIATVNVNRLSSTVSAPATTVPVLASGEDPAVILFTSGSTGTPKGIVLRHRNLVNHIEGYVKTWNIGREVVLQQSAFSFDLSIGQIFTALAMGGILVVAPEETRRDPAMLASLIRREKVTWTLLTPSEYAGVLQSAPDELRSASSWQHALACGEALTPRLVREFAALGHQTVRLYNCYGPAEAIISATMAEIHLRDGDVNGAVPVGRPNANYSIRIIDEHRNLVPQGFPGEILIGGCGVGVGYLDEEQLTNDKFLPNKFVSTWDVKHGWNVSYRTGDVGRLRPDGTLMHEGRLEGDSQVKIRGFRVDLLDIESTLLNESTGIIADAVITMRSEAQVLVAHVIFVKGQLPSEGQSAYLSELLASLPLPAYMKPTVAVPVDEFPKNPHGKKDRRAIVALPLPQTMNSPATNGTGIPTALSPVEARLAEAWFEILPPDFTQLSAITGQTDFFAVGGNSLLLVKLQARIRAAFNVSLPLIQLLDVSVLSTMATLVEASRVVDTVDWEQETALDAELLDIASRPPVSSVKTADKTIVLTGATGYFGPYLLEQLISDPAVTAIHCVAVRAEKQSDAEARLPKSITTNTKVTVYPGDLGHPLLGLPQAVFSELSNTADLIIHSGARRSFWDSYYSLRDTNVASTRTLLHLSAPRRVPIHFLSTSGVLLLSDATNPYLTTTTTTTQKPQTPSLRHTPPPTDGSDGYVASKWASEVLLERAAHALRLPIAVHRFTPRPGPVASAADAGLGQGSAASVAAAAALEDLIAPTTALGALPERSTWSGRFDVVRSAVLAGAVVGAELGSGGSEEGAVQFVHHAGEAALTPGEMFDFFKARLGKVVKRRMGLLEWVGAIKREGYGWLFSTHDLALTRRENGVETSFKEDRVVTVKTAIFTVIKPYKLWPEATYYVKPTIWIRDMD